MATSSARYHGASRPRPYRVANETTSTNGPRKPRAKTPARNQAGRDCTCGSQSHAWRDGRTSTSAYGFVATTSSPTTPRASSEPEESEQRPVASGVAVGSERERVASGPNARDGEQLEDGSHPEPERKSASIASEGRGDGQVPAPAAGEQVDRRDHERQERRDQDELDRPAANDSGAQIDVARCALDELGALVEGTKKLL